MADVERVTLTLPADLVREIDRREKDRSKFVAEAVRKEIDRRRREEFQQSLQNPHPESVALADEVLEERFYSLPDEDTESLVDSSMGTPVHWVLGKGWVEEQKGESVAVRSSWRNWTWHEGTSNGECGLASW